MPKVFDLNGFRFYIHPMSDMQVSGGRVEHLPEHVHAIKAREEVVIEIETLNIRTVKSMGRPNVRRAVRIVAANQQLLMDAWRRING